MPHPASLKAVRAYIGAFETPGFSVQIAPSKGEAGVALRREWTAEELIAGIEFLAGHNARGLNIYARPRGTRYILIDDISRATAERMAADGLAPRLLLETSPNNFAGWIDLGPGLTVEEATEAARIVASRYGGDAASADAQHLSRLAGFTNRKPTRRLATGQFPFVKIASSSRAIARDAESLKAEARAAAALRAARESAAKAAQQPAGEGAGGELDGLYGEFARDLGDRSQSQVDFIVALRALRAGHKTSAVETIIASGTDLVGRKAAGLTGPAAQSRVAGYISQTVRRAAERLARNGVTA
jgi:hypothetical protein